jgi:membrane fusion protein (multidrug efflux system)
VRRRAGTVGAAAIGLAAFVAAAGCSKSGGDGGGHGGGGGGGPMKMPPMPAEVATVEQAPMADRFEAVGTLEAGESMTVVSEIDGIVVEMPFREGAPVKRGAVLARLDAVQLRAEVERAAALRDQSRAKYDRIKTVVDQAAGAPQDLDDAAAELKVAEANLALSESRLSKARIAAPWEGIVGSRRVSPGAFVRAGEEITDLTQVRQMKVRFAAPERYLGTLQRGAAVKLTTPAFPDVAIEGRIDVVEPILDPDLRTARIVARVENPDGRLRPGMSANVTAVLDQRDMALSVPAEAVFFEGAQAFVFVVGPDSSVARVGIQLGTRTPDRVEVKTGLAPGQQVVVAGHQKLFPGAKVMPVPGSGGAPAAGQPPAGAGAAPGGAAPPAGAAADTASAAGSTPVSGAAPTAGAAAEE